jgi:hypothetical protein
MRNLHQVLEFLLDTPANRHIIQTPGSPTVTLRFACDGAKITKYRNSVRGVCKLMQPKGDLQGAHINDSSDDELTLFLYMGKFTF